MARYIPDIKTRRWIVISPQRAKRPDQVDKPEPDEQISQRQGYSYLSSCPFCLGNEDQTPPEISRTIKSADRFVEITAAKNQASTGWLVRTVPNKYPITDFHEVIIHSPDHLKDIAEFDPFQIEIILKNYRSRYNANQNFGNVIIFNNKGEGSGESLVHPHSQVVVIPKQIKLDLLSLEPIQNPIEENNFFVVYCPDFSQWPYEVWIAPKVCFTKEGEKFTFGVITDEQIKDLTNILKTTLSRLKQKYQEINSNSNDFSYNFYISPFKNWYLRIIPRFIKRAGFELGTGLSVNITDPAQACQELKKIKV